MAVDLNELAKLRKRLETGSPAMGDSPSPPATSPALKGQSVADIYQKNYGPKGCGAYVKDWLASQGLKVKTLGSIPKAAPGTGIRPGDVLHYSVDGEHWAVVNPDGKTLNEWKTSGGVSRLSTTRTIASQAYRKPVVHRPGYMTGKHSFATQEKTAQELGPVTRFMAHKPAAVVQTAREKADRASAFVATLGVQTFGPQPGMDWQKRAQKTVDTYAAYLGAKAAGAALDVEGKVPLRKEKRRVPMILSDAPTPHDKPTNLHEFVAKMPDEAKWKVRLWVENGYGLHPALDDTFMTLVPMMAQRMAEEEQEATIARNIRNQAALEANILNKATGTSGEIARAVASSGAVLDLVQASIVGDDERAVTANTVMSLIKPHPRHEKMEGMGLGEAMLAFLKDPELVLTEFIRSGIMFAPGLAAGGVAELLGSATGIPGVGRAAGATVTGLYSGYLEGILKYYEALKAEGVDTTNPYALREALYGDPELAARVFASAVKKGVPIGLLDGASYALAGVLSGGTKAIASRTILHNVLRGMGEVGLQMTTGGLGEALGQLWADGKIESWSDVAAEAILELVPGIGEIGIGVLRQSVGEKADELGRPLEEAELVEFIKMLAAEQTFAERETTGVAGRLADLDKEIAGLEIRARDPRLSEEDRQHAGVRMSALEAERQQIRQAQMGEPETPIAEGPPITAAKPAAAEPTAPPTVEQPPTGETPTEPTAVPTPPTAPLTAEQPVVTTTLAAETPSQQIASVPTEELVLDPGRFQFRMEANVALQQIKRWRPELGGVILVWRDPADGQTYVVNGHHRVSRAKQLGVESLNVMYVEAANAKEARAIGALTNIAEGNATPIEAAKFFRDSGLTTQDLEAEGVSLTGKVAGDGLALSRLNDNLFNAVIDGSLNITRAVVIGKRLEDHAAQDALMATIRAEEKRGKKIDANTLEELIRKTLAGPVTTVKQTDLFGEQEITKNLAVEEAQLSAYVRGELREDKQVFNKLSKEKVRERARRGENIINIDKNAELKAEAELIDEIYEKLSVQAGPISEILREGAQRLAQKENANAVKADIYRQIREAVLDYVKTGEAQGAEPSQGRGPEERPAPSPEPTAEPEVAPEPVPETPQPPQEPPQPAEPTPQPTEPEEAAEGEAEAAEPEAPEPAEPAPEEIVEIEGEMAAPESESLMPTGEDMEDLAGGTQAIDDFLRGMDNDDIERWFQLPGTDPNLLYQKPSSMIPADMRDKLVVLAAAAQAKGQNISGWLATLPERVAKLDAAYLNDIWADGGTPAAQNRLAEELAKVRQKRASNEKYPHGEPLDSDENTLKSVGLVVVEAKNKYGKTYYYVQGTEKKGRIFDDDVQGVLNELSKKEGRPKAWTYKVGSGQWRHGLSQNPTATLAEAVRQGSIVPPGGEGTGERPSYGGYDPEELARRREQFGGLQPRSIGELVGSFVEASTQRLLRLGIKFGIPEHVVQEQIEDVAMAVRAYAEKAPTFILANKPGTGKTFVLTAMIREIARLNPDQRFVWVTTSQDLITQIMHDSDEYQIGNIEFVSYAGTRATPTSHGHPVDTRGAVLIFDECQNIKNLRTQQGEAGQRMIQDAALTVFSSATPFENPVQAEYLKATGLFKEYADDADPTGFRQWAITLGAMVRTVMVNRGGRMEPVEVYHWPGGRHSRENLKTAHTWLKSQGLYTQRKKQLPVGPDGKSLVTAMFRLLTVDEKWVDLYTRVRSAYRLAEMEAANPREAAIIAGHKMNMLKRILESSKVEQAIEAANEYLAKGQQVVLFCETKSAREFGRYKMNPARAKEYGVDPNRWFTYDEMNEWMGTWSAEAAALRATGDTPMPPPFHPAIFKIAATFQRMGLGEMVLPGLHEALLNAEYKRPDGKKARVLAYTGTETLAQAKKNVDQWKAGQADVLVATMAKGGTGLSLHDPSGKHPQRVQIAVNLPWTGTQVEQVSGRLARYGMVKPCTVEWLIADNIPIEATIANRVGARMADMGALVEGMDTPGADMLEDFNLENTDDPRNVFIGEADVQMQLDDSLANLPQTIVPPSVTEIDSEAALEAALIAAGVGEAEARRYTQLTARVAKFWAKQNNRPISEFWDEVLTHIGYGVQYYEEGGQAIRPIGIDTGGIARGPQWFTRFQEALVFADPSDRLTMRDVIEIAFEAYRGYHIAEPVMGSQQLVEAATVLRAVGLTDVEAQLGSSFTRAELRDAMYRALEGEAARSFAETRANEWKRARPQFLGPSGRYVMYWDTDKAHWVVLDWADNFIVTTGTNRYNTLAEAHQLVAQADRRLWNPRYEALRQPIQGFMDPGATTPGRSILQLMEFYNRSTYIHELFHMLEGILPDELIAVLAKWTGVRAGDYLRTSFAREMGAEAFVHYMATAEPPTPELAGLFRDIREWLHDEAGVMDRAGRATPFSAEVKGVIDGILAGTIGTDPRPQSSTPPPTLGNLWQMDLFGENQPLPDLRLDASTTELMDSLPGDAEGLAKLARDAYHWYELQYGRDQAEKVTIRQVFYEWAMNDMTGKGKVERSQKAAELQAFARATGASYRKGKYGQYWLNGDKHPIWQARVADIKNWLTTLEQARSLLGTDKKLTPDLLDLMGEADPEVLFQRLQEMQQEYEDRQAAVLFQTPAEATPAKLDTIPTAAEYYARQARYDAGQWVQSMIGQFGEDIIPQLARLWAGVIAKTRIGQPGYTPQRTMKVYKLLATKKTRPGEVFPLFIGAKQATPIGEWIPGEHIPTKGFAERPGWHVAPLPKAEHLMTKAGEMQAGRVWVEAEVPADIDWQAIADASPTRDIKAMVPTGGFYRFPRPQRQGGEWLIAGAIKVNRILTNAEAAEIAERGEIAEPEGAQPQMLFQLPQDPNALDNPAVEEAYMRDRGGIDRVTYRDRVLGWLTRFWHRMTRIYEHLPRGGEYSRVQNALRRLSHQQGVATRKTIEYLRQITEGLSLTEFDQFIRYVFVASVWADLQENPNQPFPYQDLGWTPQAVEADYNRLHAIVQGNDKLRTAWETRMKIWDEIRLKYIPAFAAIGVDMSHKFTKKNYYHYIVLDFAQNERVMGTWGLKTPRRGYQKTRKGSTFGIDQNYLESEFLVMAQMQYDIEVARVIKTVQKNHDILGDLKAEAKHHNIEATIPYFEDEARKWNRTHPDDQKTWQDMFRWQLHMKQGMACNKLGEIAVAGDLPDRQDGYFAEVIQNFKDYFLDPTSARSPLLDTQVVGTNKLMQYLAWLLDNHGGTEAARAAALFFKGHAEKQAKIEKIAGDSYVTWEDLAHQRQTPTGTNYTIWQPEKGNMFYQAQSLPEKFVEKLLSGVMEELGVTKDMLRQIVAMGGPKLQMVIPEELAATLDEYGAENKENFLGAATKEIQLRWKGWILLNIMRAIGYNVRNMTGDIEPVIRMHPRALKYVGRAMVELYAVAKGETAPTEDMADWIEQGGWTGSLSIQETKDIESLADFAKFYKKGWRTRDIPAKVWQKYWKTVRLGTNMRESLLRYADYLARMDEYKEKGRPTNYGASIREEVEALYDPENEMQSWRDMSFKLSNELLGAYDETTALGREMSDHLVPFWRWKEINMSREYRMFVNSVASNDQICATLARNLVGKAVFLPLTKAMLIGRWALYASACYTMYAAFNLWRHPDEEDELPEEDRMRPHIIIGRAKNGRIRYISRLGALADNMEWFGLNKMGKWYIEFGNGNMSIKDIALEMAKSPLETLIESIGPMVKLPTELILGVSTWPNPFNPRPMYDRVEHLAGQFSAKEVYRKVRGVPTSPIWERMLWTSTDPDEAAYYETRDEVDKWLEKHGGKAGGRWVGKPTKRKSAGYFMKRSVAYQDRPLFDRWYAEFERLTAEEGKNFKNSLDDIIDAQDPLGELSAEQKVEFRKSIAGNDRVSKRKRAKLEDAEKYHKRFETWLTEEYLRGLARK